MDLSCWMLVIMILVPNGWDIEGSCKLTRWQCLDSAGSYGALDNVAAWCVQRDRV